MSLPFIAFSGLVALLLLALAWAFYSSRKLPDTAASESTLEGCDQHHVNYLPQIKQALSSADLTFLTNRGTQGLMHRVRRERKQVALGYLEALKTDFERLLRLAKIIAVLSPAVSALHEWERFRLGLTFRWRYEMIRLRLIAGFALTPQLGNLSNLVSGLHVRIETAMQELGERAALATKMASALGRGGMDVG